MSGAQFDTSQLDGITEVNGMRIEMLPKAVIEFNIEIASHHPELIKLLNESLKVNNFEPDIYYGTIAAYCGIVLEGAYNQEYLIEQLSKAIIAKRTTLVVATLGADTVKVAKALLQ